MEFLIYMYLVITFTIRYLEQRRLNPDSYVSKLPLVVAILVALEDVFYVCRMNAILPIWDSENPKQFDKFVYFNALSIILYLAALLIFSLRYHQASNEVCDLLDKERGLVSKKS